MSTKSSPLKRKLGENRSLTGGTGVKCISSMTSLEAKNLSFGDWGKNESPCLKQMVESWRLAQVSSLSTAET